MSQKSCFFIVATGSMRWVIYKTRFLKVSAQLDKYQPCKLLSGLCIIFGKPPITIFNFCNFLEFEFSWQFCFVYHIYPTLTRKRIVSLCFGRYVHTRLGVAISEVSGPHVFYMKVGRLLKCLTQGHNKQTCWLVLHNLP